MALNDDLTDIAQLDNGRMIVLCRLSCSTTTHAVRCLIIRMMLICYMVSPKQTFQHINFLVYDFSLNYKHWSPNYRYLLADSTHTVTQ